MNRQRSRFFGTFGGVFLVGFSALAHYLRSGFSLALLRQLSESIQKNLRPPVPEIGPLPAKVSSEQQIQLKKLQEVRERVRQREEDHWAYFSNSWGFLNDRFSC